MHIYQQCVVVSSVCIKRVVRLYASNSGPVHSDKFRWRRTHINLNSPCSSDVLHLSVYLEIDMQIHNEPSFQRQHLLPNMLTLSEFTVVQTLEQNDMLEKHYLILFPQRTFVLGICKKRLSEHKFLVVL